MIQLKSLQCAFYPRSAFYPTPVRSLRSLQFTLTGAKLNHVLMHMYFTCSLQFAPEGNENLCGFK